MPKEVIYNQYSRATPSGLDTNPEYLHIGWTPGSEHVEVASVHPHGALSLQEGGEWHSVDGPTPGWFIQLDRQGINAAIRALRKARDAAYGADE